MTARASRLTCWLTVVALWSAAADALKIEAGECGCGEPEPIQAGAACSPDGGVPDEERCVVGPITDELRW
jgi:hypothetical protein